MHKLLNLAFIAAPLAAQQPLTLRDAVRLALEQHPAVQAGNHGVRAAQARIAEARSGWMPKVNYSETFMRSNNPVVVFSSLLTQHQFTERNFMLGPLNRPSALNNFQSQLTVDQSVYDAGQTKLATRSAELGRNMTEEERRLATMQVIAGVVRGYHGAILAAESLTVADEALRSAEADLNRARSIREAGMSTDADVLSIQVHLASVREQQIRRRADVEVARAALNEAIGGPLTATYSLTTPLTAVSLKTRDFAEYEKDGVEQRPEMRQSRLAASLAETQGSSARSSLLPQVVFRGAFEADRQQFLNRGGTNWLAAVSLRWNVFNGLADRARIEEASYGLLRARALEKQAESQIKLHVRRAYEDFRAAEQRIEVANAAVAQAEESLRITKNRFDAGLSNVTDLLRTETSVLEARNRRLNAIYDQRMAAVNLVLASGTLSADSEALN